VAARQELLTSDIAPMTPAAAYVHGLEASRRGDDLGDVIYTAMTTWSGDARFCSELLACAMVGYLASEWRRPGTRKPQGNQGQPIVSDASTRDNLTCGPASRGRAKNGPEWGGTHIRPHGAFEQERQP
jgi:hypothetical protein